MHTDYLYNRSKKLLEQELRKKKNHSISIKPPSADNQTEGKCLPLITKQSFRNVSLQTYTKKSI